MDGIITLAQAQRLDKMLRGAIWSSGEGTNSYRYPEGLLSYVEQQPRSPWPMLVYYEGFGAMKLLLAYSRPEGNFLPASTVLQALEMYRDVFGGHLQLIDDPEYEPEWWFTAYKNSMLADMPGGSIPAKTCGPCDSAEELLDALLGAHP